MDANMLKSFEMYMGCLTCNTVDGLLRTHAIMGEILIHIQMKLGKKISPNGSHVHLE